MSHLEINLLQFIGIIVGVIITVTITLILDHRTEIKFGLYRNFDVYRCECSLRYYEILNEPIPEELRNRCNQLKMKSVEKKK